MVLSRLEAHQGLHCEPPQRRARGVAIAIGILLSIGASPISEASIDAIEPKAYIRSILDKPQALCLIKLYGKESAFNRYAIGNIEGKKQAYGIPQLKNPEVGLMNAVEQVNAGIDYIEYRYGTPCRAYAHYKKKGWH
jgi:hypothetical protein